MLRNTLAVTAIAGALVFATGFASAADQAQTPTKAQAQKRTQENIYGSQLMTAEERRAFRAQMRSAKTVEEREQIRAAHHEAMKVRAKERGVTIPDEPPARGGGMGPGSGMGPGGGMGMGGGKR